MFSTLTLAKNSSWLSHQSKQRGKGERGEKETHVVIVVEGVEGDHIKGGEETEDDDANENSDDNDGEKGHHDKSWCAKSLLCPFVFGGGAGLDVKLELVVVLGRDLRPVRTLCHPGWASSLCLSLLAFCFRFPSRNSQNDRQTFPPLS